MHRATASVAQKILESSAMRRRLEEAIEGATRDWVLELDSVLEPFLPRLTL